MAMPDGWKERQNRKDCKVLTDPSDSSSKGIVDKDDVLTYKAELCKPDTEELKDHLKTLVIGDLMALSSWEERTPPQNTGARALKVSELHAVGQAMADHLKMKYNYGYACCTCA